MVSDGIPDTTYVFEVLLMLVTNVYIKPKKRKMERSGNEQVLTLVFRYTHIPRTRWSILSQLQSTFFFFFNILSQIRMSDSLENILAESLGNLSLEPHPNIPIARSQRRGREISQVHRHAIHSLRAHADWTIRRIAQQLNIPRSTIHRLSH